VLGFPQRRLLRGLRPSGGASRRLTRSLRGEPPLVPKFAEGASSRGGRSCLYAWHGSLPRLEPGTAGCSECCAPASGRGSACIEKTRVPFPPSSPSRSRMVLGTTLQTALPCVTMTTLWLAAHESRGAPAATLSRELQTRGCLDSPRLSLWPHCPLLAGFLCGMSSFCASWRTLDAPVPTDQGEQSRGISAFGWQAGDVDVVGDLDAGVASRDAASEGDAVALKAADLAHVRPGSLVGSGTAKPAEHARMADGPEHPEFAPSVADFRLSLEDAGDPSALVDEPAWGDRYAVAVLGRYQPWGKMPPRPLRAALAGWHLLAGRSHPPA
jgi:hypothetical protein